MDKKKYVKPVVMIENFLLSQCIATGCSGTLVNGADITCLPDDLKYLVTATDPNMFGGKLTCTNVVDLDNGGEGFNGYCYHTSSETNRLFAS